MKGGCSHFIRVFTLIRNVCILGTGRMGHVYLSLTPQMLGLSSTKPHLEAPSSNAEKYFYLIFLIVVLSSDLEYLEGNIWDNCRGKLCPTMKLIFLPTEGSFLSGVNVVRR